MWILRQLPWPVPVCWSTASVSAVAAKCMIAAVFAGFSSRPKDIRTLAAKSLQIVPFPITQWFYILNFRMMIVSMLNFGQNIHASSKFYLFTYKLYPCFSPSSPQYFYHPIPTFINSPVSRLKWQNLQVRWMMPLDLFCGPQWKNKTKLVTGSICFLSYSGRQNHKARRSALWQGCLARVYREGPWMSLPGQVT